MVLDRQISDGKINVLTDNSFSKKNKVKSIYFRRLSLLSLKIFFQRVDMCAFYMHGPHFFVTDMLLIFRNNDFSYAVKVLLK
jgi:hypothetical protein